MGKQCNKAVGTVKSQSQHVRFADLSYAQGGR